MTGPGKPHRGSGRPATYEQSLNALLLAGNGVKEGGSQTVANGYQLKVREKTRMNASYGDGGQQKGETRLIE